MAATLEAHNRFRKAHGVPELKWSEECCKWAQKCADECEKLNAMKHCFCKPEECDGNQFGQNIFFGSVK